MHITSIKVLWPSNGGGVSLVLAEAVDAFDGSSLDVVAQEEAMVPPGPPTSLLHYHQHHGLYCMAVAGNTVPVIPLQLQKQRRAKYYSSNWAFCSPNTWQKRKCAKLQLLPCPGWCKGPLSSDRKHKTGWLNPGWAADRWGPPVPRPNWWWHHCWAPETGLPGLNHPGLEEETSPYLEEPIRVKSQLRNAVFVCF